MESLKDGMEQNVLSLGGPRVRLPLPSLQTTGSLLMRSRCGVSGKATPGCSVRLFSSDSSLVSDHGRVAVIIFADTLLFPSIFLTGTVIESVGFRLASPEGTLLSTNNYIALNNVFSTFLGRGLGPPTARAILTAASGQTGYASQQLLLSAVAVVLMEGVVIQHLHLLDKEFENDVLRSPRETPVPEDGKEGRRVA